MAEFQTMSGTKLASAMTSVVGSKMKLKLIAGKGEVVPIAISISPVANAKIEGLDVRKQANFTIFTLNILAVGKLTLIAGPAQKPVAGPVVFDVEAKLGLPDAKTDAGLFARLLIAETPSPDMNGYSDADAEIAMKMMHAVIRNRFAKPSHLYASKDARSINDVVKAKGQFKGFESYPDVEDKIAARIVSTLAVANDGGDGRRTKYKAFIQIALRVAALDKADAGYATLYYWRTEGSGSPTSNATAFKTVMGNTFYALKPDAK